MRPIVKQIARLGFRRGLYGLLAACVAFLCACQERDFEEKEALLLDLPGAVKKIPSDAVDPVRVGAEVRRGDGLAFQVVLVLASHFTQEVDGLSAAAWRSVAEGKISHWSETGGGRRKIAFYAPEDLRPRLLRAFPFLSENPRLLWVPRDEMERRLTREENALAILPLGRVRPRYKILTIEGASPVENQGDAGGGEYLEGYPLKIPLSVDDAGGDETGAWISEIKKEIRAARFRPDQLKSVLITGRSLIGQGIAYDKTPPKDPLWPVRKIAPFFRRMDIAHISNECALIDGCVQKKGDWKFCGEKSYIEALKFAGFDLVELTGKHLTGFGRKAAAATMELYEKAGMATFGGGRNLAEARKIRVLTVRGTRFAFIGYNDISSKKRLATKDKAGALDLRPEWLIEDIRAAVSLADVVFVHFQWGPEFAPTPRPRMIRIAHEMIREGATVVTGTHAHRTSAMEFFKDGVIFYGLGNFLLAHPGQKWTERSLAVRYTFLDGRLLNIRPMGLALEDFQSRFLEPEEENELLARLFGNSRKNLSPFPFHPMIPADLKIKDRQSFRFLERALFRAGVDTAILSAQVETLPTREELARLNDPPLSVKPRFLKKILPVATLHPEDTGRNLRNYLERGAVGFRLLLGVGANYPKALLKALDEAGHKGRFVFLEVIGAKEDFSKEWEALASSLPRTKLIYNNPGLWTGSRDVLERVLESHATILVAIPGFPDKVLESLARWADFEDGGLRELLVTHRHRFVAGPGLAAFGQYRRKNKETQGLFFRMMAFKNLLENSSYSFPILSHRGSEWSYKYEQEETRRGLALPAEVLADIYTGNISKLID